MIDTQTEQAIADLEAKRAALEVALDRRSNAVRATHRAQLTEISLECDVRDAIRAVREAESRVREVLGLEGNQCYDGNGV